MPKTVPDLPGIPASDYPYSPIVEANGFVFVAGQVGDVPGQKGAVPGGIEAETRQMLENVGTLLRAVGLDYARRREMHRVPARLHRVRRDERGLPRVLPGSATRPARPSASAGSRWTSAWRSRSWRPAERPPRPRILRVYFATTNSSIATMGCPAVPATTILSVCSAALFQVLRKATVRAVNDPSCRSIVFTYLPSR